MGQQHFQRPNRELKAWGCLLQKWSRFTVNRCIGNLSRANDVLQNTFLKAWSRLDSFRGEAKLSTWLYRIAVNEALDFLRRQRTVLEAGDEALLSASRQLMADSYFDGDKLQSLLQSAIALLPDVQRTVFCMRYYDDMKYSEISKVLGTSEGAFESQLSPCREKNRSCD